MSDLMLIEVFGGTCVSSCDTCAGSCSTGSSGTRLEKEVELLEFKLKEQYGDKVEVKYVDTDQVGLNVFPMVARAVRAGYTFPIIAVNGDPRLAGGIDFAAVHQLLEEELQPKDM
jgi:hypothetical protein